MPHILCTLKAYTRCLYESVDYDYTCDFWWRAAQPIKVARMSTVLADPAVSCRPHTCTLRNRVVLRI